MLRFCKASTPSDKEHPLIVTAPEREQAMIKLWLLSQKESFPKEMQTLGEGKSMLKNSIIVNHSPFLGPRGLIRSTGRIKHLTVIDFDTKHPIILDSRHPVVLKFLIETHENNHHQGVKYVRTLVQRKYAILKLRFTLRSIQRNCVTCRKFRAKPPTPIMSDLPKERLGYKLKPFTFTGVDYFGPLYVTVRRSTQKRWGFLFTCLTTRATHIEIAHSLDADFCIMGVERFMARRGKPKVIWSDNGTNFVGAEKELLGHLKSVDQHRIKSKMSQNGIFWKFNPPANPHQGGAWERLVQSSKRLFYKILGNRRLTDEVLSTVFCLVEQFLNARPLVPASSDVTDLEALTPNHFLLGEVTSLPSFESSKGLDRHDHRRRYKQAIAYADLIWQRWLLEYIPTLNTRRKWNSPSRELNTGDLVWISDTTSPRNYFPLARIQTLHFGKDSVARSATLKTKSGMLTRPIVRLIPVFDTTTLGVEDVTDHK